MYMIKRFITIILLFEVAVEAVKLVISILKYHPDILSDKVGIPSIKFLSPIPLSIIFTIFWSWKTSHAQFEKLPKIFTTNSSYFPSHFFFLSTIPIFHCLFLLFFPISSFSSLSSSFFLLFLPLEKLTKWTLNHNKG